MAYQTIVLSGTLPPLDRTNLTQELLAAYPIPWTYWRVWNAMQTNLPGAAADDDLGLIGGTWASATPMIQSSNPTGAAVLQYARAQFPLSPEYDPGQRVYFRMRAKIAEVCGTKSQLDVAVFESDKEAGLGSDLSATLGPYTLTTSYDNYDFVLTPTGLVPGDMLDIRIKVDLDDTGAHADGIVSIGYTAILCDIRG